MKQFLVLPKTSLCASVLIFSFLLSACGLDSGGDSPSQSSNDVSSDTLVTAAFSGSVGDGPVVAATLNIYDRDGNLVRTVISDNTAKYSAKVKTKGKAYPLTIEVEGGTDLVTQLAPDFRMTSFISHPSIKNININPFTTLIVEAARTLPGGLNKENIAAAGKIVQEKLNFGLDPAVVTDAITTKVDDVNIAVFIKSSETMGEMIRRTRDRLMAIGVVGSGDDVVAALAHDIADGELDGLGGSKASIRVATVSKLISAQVVIEALSNNLKVGDRVATDRMDDAIFATHPLLPRSSTTDSVAVNQELLVQGRDTIKVAQKLSPSDEVDTIAAILDILRAGSLASQVEAVLPADTSEALDQPVSVAVAATDEQLDSALNGDGTTIPTDPPTDPPLANRAPVLSGTPATTVLEDAAYLYQPSATDADGDTLSFSIQNRPDWATFNMSTGRLSGTPKNPDLGTYSNIVVMVSDGELNDSVGPFSITVTNTNDAPSISGSPAISATAGGFYSFQPSASDPDGDELIFSIAKRPSWASFNATSGQLSGTPANGDAGTYDGIVISVSDGSVSRSLTAFTITVSASLPSNRAPVISGTPATSVAEDSAYVFQPTATDADGDSLTYSISNRPAWASFNGTSGRLAGTPENSHVGSYNNILITVSDGAASAAVGPFSITVSNTNDAPVISGTPASSVAEDSAYVFRPTASDADGDSLTYSISNRPAWASFNGTSGRLAGTPENSHVGSYNNILITVSDGAASAAVGPFTITVNNTNDAPVISGTPANSVDEGSVYSFKLTASDPDGDNLIFSIQNRPAWASFNTGTGGLTGTPSEGDAGTYSNILIAVSDGSETAGLPAFSIRVDAVATANNAPVINGTPAATVVADTSYEFQPSATDADGDPLTFSLSNKPTWASFNTATGNLSGTPGASDQGFYDNIVISVTDGTDVVSLAAFSIRVDAAVSAARVATDLVAYYPFTEGAGSLVRDQSGNGTPMDLTMTGSVNWLGGGNGVIMSGGRVGTSGAATKLIDALRSSNTSTIEVWVKPANLTQSGPTRMISLGSGTSQQNFMIGQVESGVEARLMHEGKEYQGRPWLTTGSGVLGLSPRHLVHTYDGAVERLYVNGVQRSETVAIGGAYSNWDVSALFSIGNEASLDRPYAGVIYLAAVYDRPLGVAEIQQNFSAGPGETGDSGGSGSVNTAPVISGSPATSVTVGNSYSFQPNATDANGDSLAFSISNKPGWASFDVATGRLSGTPSDADAGSYGNIVISVSDGSTTVTLLAFSVTVNSTAPATGFASLSWVAPVARANGDPLALSEIEGYVLYYGASAGNYPNSLQINDGSSTSFTITDLPFGTYYFVMTTKDTQGNESVFSDMVSKVVN